MQAAGVDDEHVDGGADGDDRMRQHHVLGRQARRERSATETATDVGDSLMERDFAVGSDGIGICDGVWVHVDSMPVAARATAGRRRKAGRVPSAAPW